MSSPQSPSIGVFVPSYNHAAFVADCLKSILKQTLQPTKLLVIDDGSKDESPRVIASVLRDCRFPCELIARENRGLTPTLNQALSLLNGEYFAYLGSDDVWLNDFLAARTQLLGTRPKAVLAYGHSYFIDRDNKVVDCTADWADYKDGDVREMLLQTIAPMSPTVLYRREALAKYGWNENARLEDYELYLKLSLDGEFAFDPKVLSAWRQHADNTSRDQEMMLEEHLSALGILAPSFGISGTDLDSLMKAISLSRAEDFLRVGNKRRAIELVVKNLNAADGVRLMPILKRLLIPYSAVSWWRRKKEAKAIERYGRVEI